MFINGCIALFINGVYLPFINNTEFGDVIPGFSGLKLSLSGHKSGLPALASLKLFLLGLK